MLKRKVSIRRKLAAVAAAVALAGLLLPSSYASLDPLWLGDPSNGSWERTDATSGMWCEQGTACLEWCEDTENGTVATGQFCCLDRYADRDDSSPAKTRWGPDIEETTMYRANRAKRRAAITLTLLTALVLTATPPAPIPASP